MDATHLLLDQPRCFQVVAAWNPKLKGKFDQWLLPSPHRSLGEAAGLPWRPPPDPTQPPDDEELHVWIVGFASSVGR